MRHRPRPDQTRKAMNVPDVELQRCVAEYSTGRFKMTKGEVNKGWQTYERPTRTGQLTTAKYFILTHRPTGITVHAHIRPGNYSKNELRKLTDKALKDYMPILEHMVVRYLKMLMGRQFGPIPKGEYNDPKLR